MSAQFGLLVTLKAAGDREDDLEKFLTDGLKVVEKETGTKTWYAIRQDENTFSIFDTFDSEEDRDAHLSGDFAQSLEKEVGELLASPAHIRPLEILAAKAAK